MYCLKTKHDIHYWYYWLRRHSSLTASVPEFDPKNELHGAAAAKCERNVIQKAIQRKEVQIQQLFNHSLTLKAYLHN